MEFAPDRYRYVLEQPIREAPGQSWIYSGGATALIGKLIEDGTGMRLDAYAKARLFEPLGITEFTWHAGADGVPSPASGLRLTLADLVRIGHLIANGGKVGDRQIVPVDWLERSFQSRVSLNEHVRYGLLWYLSGREDDPVIFAAGNGGQRLTVEPASGLVVAVTAGRYNDPNGWQTGLTLLFDFALPEARRRMSK